MLTKDVKCNICDADDYTVLFPPGKAQVHRIVKCNKCNLIYANPQTDNVAGVEKHYASIGGDSEEAMEAALKDFVPEKHQYLKKQFLQLKDYNKIINFVDKPDKGTFLEIGSYAGIFLNEAKKKGWKVLGMEPLSLPAYYSEKLGVPVLREYFDKNTNIPDKSVDVIVATHVIEHIPDPSEFVAKAYSLLTEKGKLILETPTYDSFFFKLLKHRERSVRCGGHIYFFTKESLTKLVEKEHFKVIKYEKVGRTLTLERLFYNFGVMTGKKQFFEKAGKKLGLDKFVIKINARDMQRIYCEKV